MNKRILNLATIVICAIFGVFSNQSFANQSNPQGYVIHVPSGIIQEAVLASEINSQNAIIGQNINAVLIEDFKYKNHTIASAGSILQGSIVSNITATKNRDSQILIKFTTIRTPYNNLIPISATISTQDSTGILKGKIILIPANEKINLYFDQPITLGAQ